MSDRMKMPKDFSYEDRIYEGKQLATKDGRKTGNAIVVRYSGVVESLESGKERVWIVVTDFGHVLPLTDSDLQSMFYLDHKYDNEEGFEKWIDDRKSRSELYNKVMRPGPDPTIVEESYSTDDPMPTTRYLVPGTVDYYAVFVGQYALADIERALSELGNNMDGGTRPDQAVVNLYASLGWTHTVITAHTKYAVFYHIMG